jgi:exopolysaccharide biosynthesis predicted pyruvyltransferase EpsI
VITYDEVLARFRGARLFFEPLSGNNGDRLIEMGSRVAHEQAGLVTVESPHDADLITIRGNGAMNDLFGYQSGIGSLRAYATRYADVPLCVEPSTFQFANVDLKALLEPRQAETWLFARERMSFASLESMHLGPPVSVGLDQDMAFRLAGSDFLAGLPVSEDHVLMVERTDLEHPSLDTSSGEARLSPARRLYRLLPATVRRALRPTVTKAKGMTSSAFKRMAEHLLASDDPGWAQLPVVSLDVSHPSVPFDRFTSLVAGAAAVVTTRLHVGILAALLGKRTLLIARPSSKVQAIYDYSLASQPHVTLHLYP